MKSILPVYLLFVILGHLSVRPSLGQPKPAIMLQANEEMFRLVGGDVITTGLDKKTNGLVVTCRGIQFRLTRGTVSLKTITGPNCAAILIGELSPNMTYHTVGILIVDLSQGQALFKVCASEIAISKLAKTRCYISSLYSIDENGVVSFELAYDEKPAPPTKVLSKVVFWDTVTDEYIKSAP